MKSTMLLCFGLLLVLARPLPAAIIGTNVPARPLTRERIATLPADQQAAWLEYLTRSEQQKRADQDFLRAELTKLGRQNPTIPPAGHSADDLKLDLPVTCGHLVWQHGGAPNRGQRGDLSNPGRWLEQKPEHVQTAPLAGRGLWHG